MQVSLEQLVLAARTRLRGTVNLKSVYVNKSLTAAGFGRRGAVR